MSITCYTNSCQKSLKYNGCVTKIKIKDNKCFKVRQLIFLKCQILTHFSANPLVAMTLWALTQLPADNTKIHKSMLRILD